MYVYISICSVRRPLCFEATITGQAPHFLDLYSENTFQYKLPPKTWEKSPQKPLSTTRKWFFSHFTQIKNFYANPSNG